MQPQGALDSALRWGAPFEAAVSAIDRRRDVYLFDYLIRIQNLRLFAQHADEAVTLPTSPFQRRRNCSRLQASPWGLDNDEQKGQDAK